MAKADPRPRGPKPGSSPDRSGLTLDAMGALSVAALITLLFLIGLLMVQAAGLPHLAGVMPAIQAGILASSLILFRQWWRGRQTAEAEKRRTAQAAAHDPITRLPNRPGFLAALEGGEFAGQEAPVGQGAMVAIGLTRLEEIADNLGEAAARQVLEEMSRRLGAAFQGSALVGRVGEDVFAVTYRTTSSDRLSLLSGRVNQLINMPVETIAGRIVVGGALGVAFAALPMTDAAETLRQARLALSSARRAGGAVALFEPSMDAAHAIRMAMEAELRETLKRGGMRMVYQPQVDERGKLVGVEALMRWESPERGSVPPAVFVPLAEASGLGEALGRFALDQAMADSRRWPGIKVAINVSPAQLQSLEFLAEVEALLKTHGASASNLEMEITEGSLLESNPVVHANLDGLRRLGFELALDDFGAGYSGFGYLTQFQVDKIKIDRSFVTPLGSRSDAASIIRAITDLSRAVGVKVLAEGVETRQQLETLRREGCHQAQGFYIGRPVPPVEIDALLARPASVAEAA